MAVGYSNSGGPNGKYFQSKNGLISLSSSSPFLTIVILFSALNLSISSLEYSGLLG